MIIVLSHFIFLLTIQQLITYTPSFPNESCSNRCGVSSVNAEEISCEKRHPVNNFRLLVSNALRIPRWLSGKEPTCQCKRYRRCGFDPWVGKISWRRKCNPLPYSCLESLVDRGLRWATARRVTKNGTRQGLNMNITTECFMVPRVTRI